MIDYRDFQERLHIRGIMFDTKQYMFVTLVCFGEEPSVAYGLVYDIENFKRNVPSENEEDYLAMMKTKGNTLLQQQECQQLKELIDENIRAEIQSQATNIKEYKYSSQEIVNMLSSLLADRSENLSDASVKDIVSLIRELANLGGLSGSDGFQSHFIQVHSKYNALCIKCNHEFYAYAGVSSVCPHCHQHYNWSEQEERFYPEPERL